MRVIQSGLVLFTMVLGTGFSSAQSSYKVISVQNGGTIKGTVKWQGPMPRLVASEINKDPQVCDALGQKHRDLERLLVSPSGGVSNTVVYLRNITAGKAMDFPEQRRFLNQKSCRYEPHILLVPLQASLTAKSSDPILHTVHMSGSADYNLPFISAGQEISRPMTREGVVDSRCNAGHIWMNAEMMVAPHPYYAVTDAEGKFEMTDVPPGQYEIVAWHEGWRVVGESPLYGVMTQVRVKRPVFSEPMIWNRRVMVTAGANAEVQFTLGEKTPHVAQAH